MRNGREFADRIKWLCGMLTGVGMLVLAGCAHSSQPVPVSGAVTQDTGQRVSGEEAGVRVVAQAQTWSGDPPTLPRYVLPIWIQVENHSGKALWLRYSTICLEDPKDSQAAIPAVPPAEVKGKAFIPVSALPPDFRLDDPWWGTELDPEFQYYIARNVHWEENMPTKEMLRRAIREGVVADGKKVAGFVYFPKTKREIVTLRADLVDATTRQPFGRIEIPLAVVKE
jgi:hypothetical protein